MKIHQIDIKEAYPNGKLFDDEIIYIKKPLSFENSKFPYYVCCL